jgi:hypothetical protein
MGKLTNGSVKTVVDVEEVVERKRRRIIYIFAPMTPTR